MFKRKNAVVAFLLVAVLLLGIGYAAVSNDLLITAVASASENDLDKDFKTALGFGAFATGTSHNVDVEVTNGNPDIAPDNLLDEVTFTANFSQKKQQAVVVYTIYNNHEDLTANLTTPVVKLGTETKNAGTYFEVTDVVLGSNSIAAGSTTTVTVTIKMIKTPVTTISETFTISFTANAAES